MFVELSATSNFSFLKGASHPEEYMARAALLGMPALAIENQHTPRFCSHLKNMLNRKSFWWTGQPTLVTAWNNPC